VTRKMVKRFIVELYFYFMIERATSSHFELQIYIHLLC
jgi:hypothetical protein